MKRIEYLKLEEIHKDHCVQNLNELCQAWCSDFFHGKPASGTDHPLSEELFPNDWPESPLRELRYYKVI